MGRDGCCHRYVVDAGPPRQGVAVAEHDPTVGSPELGSVRMSLPFDAVLQKISYEVALGDGNTGVDMTGAIIRCRIKVDSGLSTPDAPAGLKLYVKSGPNYLYADGGWGEANNINVDGTWQTVVWGVNTPGYVDPAGPHDPSDVRAVGVEVATGGAGTFTPAVVHFDSFGW